MATPYLAALLPAQLSDTRFRRRYPKVHRDLMVSTRIGGGVSLAGLLVMSVLFFTEFSAYLNTRLETTLELDDNTDQKLVISFNFSLPRVPCPVVSVDVQDMLGTRIVNVTRNVFKYHLDSNGVMGAMVGGSVSADGQHSLGMASVPAGSSGFPDLSGAAGGQKAASGPIEVRDDSTPQEYEKTLETYDAVLVNFFAPWCPHCVQFEPIWRAAKSQIEQLEFSDDVTLIMMNCNEHREFCETRQQIDRFPTIRAYANHGADMEIYYGNLDAGAIVDYVTRLIDTRKDHLKPTQTLEFHVNESVQIWWHSGWRDAHVVRRLRTDEEAEEAGGGLDYVVVLDTYEPPDVREASLQLLQFVGGLIQVRSIMTDRLDTLEHEVSAHVLRLKPQHEGEYEVGELVQLRQRIDWIIAKVTDRRPLDDSSANCTALARAGGCPRSLLECKKTCNMSTHPYEYEVAVAMVRKWVTHERLLPTWHIHVAARSHPPAVEGCMVAGQVMANRVPGTLLLRVDGKKHSFNLKSSNLSHTIHHLSFGHSDQRESFDAQAHDLARYGVPWRTLRGRTPLNGREYAPAQTHLSHEHFLKIIRTTFHFLRGTTYAGALQGLGTRVDMYHFTSSSSTHQTQPHSSPAVSITYDLSPMQVVVTEEAESLFRFIVYIFAIIGGGFTVFGIIDNVVFYGDRLLREKAGIGKAA
ncbi:hypothetical protein AB1Y20_007518 [Prymnesium parvum]|uniref:Thioredoxin domain-containing protein n=1 Tax=Prymnesium parvum TaxID=97485 RepID=A0AB34IX87_PRYPA